MEQSKEKSQVVTDTAKGPLSGYLFQFERALLLLSSLETDTDYVSIEDVDDIATHKSDGTVLISDQSKHSISQSGSTFADTSYALWRTFQIWIEKFEAGIFDKNVTFICSTNKPISSNSILHFICNNPFDEVSDRISNLRTSQGEKLDQLIKEDPSKGKSIKAILDLVDFIIKKIDVFEVIQPSIKIDDNSDLKESIHNKLHLNSEQFTDLQKNNVYEGMIGWLTSHSLYKWRNSEVAEFTKKQMDSKYQSLIHTPSVINAVFRAKHSFSIDDTEIEAKRSELFVKQIELISRRPDAKDRTIKNAIEDFIRFEIEHAYLINEIGDFTKEDFNKFIDLCYEEWQSYFDDKVVHDIAEYSDDEKNHLALDIYSFIMKKLNINFADDYSFTTNNVYIKNGSFLKLSNIPMIGWHPDWEEHFKK